MSHKNSGAEGFQQAELRSTVTVNGRLSTVILAWLFEWLKISWRRKIGIVWNFYHRSFGHIGKVTWRAVLNIRQLLAERIINVLEQPIYSLDFALCDFLFLFYPSSRGFIKKSILKAWKQSRQMYRQRWGVTQRNLSSSAQVLGKEGWKIH